MTKYILHGGFVRGAKQVDDEFFQEVLRDTPDSLKILLVYFAKEDNRIAENSREDIEQFQQNSFGKNLSFEIATQESFVNQLVNADVVYFHGGRTTRLLEAIKNFPNLTELLKGKIVVGDSAGANILCAYFSSLYTGPGRGLGIIPVKLIAHFTEDRKHTLDSIGDNLPTISLPEQQFKVYEIKD